MMVAIIGAIMLIIMSTSCIISVFTVSILIRLLMITHVPTVSLSAVFPLCLVRLVGGGEDNTKSQSKHYY